MDAIQTWEKLIDDEMTRANAIGKPISRGRATTLAVKKHPAAHRQFVEEYNRRNNPPRRVSPK